MNKLKGNIETGPEIFELTSDHKNKELMINSERPRQTVNYPINSETCQQCIPVNNLSVIKSSKVHVGTKNIAITQNITHNEVVKGRLLGLDLETSKPSRRCRCSVIVFVCWTSIVVCCLGAIVVFFVIPKARLMDIDLHEDWYLRRIEWQAMPAYSTEFLSLPVSVVVFGHSASDSCTTRYSCVEETLKIQLDHLRRDCLDIGPNFLVGGYGWVFEGRGANAVGTVVRSWNSRIISIMFIGDFSVESVQDISLEHVKILLDVLVRDGILTENYVIYGHCQIRTYTVSPGAGIMKTLNQFPHWSNENSSTCIGFRQ